jgi:two-component system, NtrC family, response regulator AtoC
VTLTIPPLRERSGEIAGLAKKFLGAGKQLTRGAIARLEQHAWPGNIRELKNVIERAALIADAEITEEHLDLAAPERPSGGSLQADVDALQRKRIIEALEACGGNQTRAAQKLGISRGTLLARLKQYGITRPRS